MAGLFEKIKRMKQRSEGLSLIKAGVEVRLRQAEWFLGREDLEEERRIQWDVIKKYSEQLLKDINDALDGRLHY